MHFAAFQRRLVRPRCNDRVAPTLLRRRAYSQYSGPFCLVENTQLNCMLEKGDAMITLVERLLIRAHSPAMNKQGTTGLLLDWELKDADEKGATLPDPELGGLW